MHMADALISPAVGATMWLATTGLVVHSARKLKADIDDRKIPLMGVMGAFIFAAQMINFAIPGTGSSGHLAGGMILAILLGPYAAFLTLASILTVQALFFADGGLLALGCNIFNMGFFPCFVAYPVIYKRIVRAEPTRSRILTGAMVSSILSLQAGALGVVLETVASGISELPFTGFLFLMQPIHLAIGIVEGIITTAVITFVWKARPEIMQLAETSRASFALSIRNVLAGFLAFAVITAGMLSWFASSHPDGLEWSIFHTSGKEELKAPEEGLHAVFAGIQEKTALLPDYGFKSAKEGDAAGAEASRKPAKSEDWPAVNAETSVSGLVGGTITLFLSGLIGLGLRKFRRS
jgi:cobalt/nickel transport system permease protein